ncbi:hypothetical protein HW555_001023 [Spodoptera exigua]|uniref:Uncharacterized protein n=1 Tax=Spodoptera exigua TaxID=7107 RepID=A0A835GSB0_SPOEX|nr:hypothetical protein HW555_001023 [Spodoptera exigua]
MDNLAAVAAAQMAFEQHSAAAMQALQHQLLRAGKGGSNSGGGAAMAAEMQRVAEAQRQYLLDMIPGQHTRNPWTKN